LRGQDLDFAIMGRPPVDVDVETHLIGHHHLPQSHPNALAASGRDKLDSGVFKGAAIQFVPYPNIPCRAVDIFCDRAALVAGP